MLRINRHLSRPLSFSTRRSPFALCDPHFVILHRRTTLEMGGPKKKSSNRRNLKAGHFMMTTKVVAATVGVARKRVGTVKRGWAATTTTIAIHRYLLSCVLNRTERRDVRENGWDGKMERARLPLSAGWWRRQGLELITFITQKSRLLFPFPHEQPLTLPSVFLTSAARHWRINKCAIYIKSRELSPPTFLSSR